MGCDAVQTGCLLASVSKGPDVVIMMAYFALVMAEADLTVILVSTSLHGVTYARIVMLVSKYSAWRSSCRVAFCLQNG